MKSIVLLSGGLDSAVCLAYGLTETKVELALTFNYGQRSATREIQAAAALANYYGVKHRVIDLPWLAEITTTSLVNEEENIPEPMGPELDYIPTAKATAAAVWVPNRNGLFVNIAACFAETLNCQLVVAGFNREEAATFPDNTPEFVTAASTAMAYSTANQVKVVSFTNRLNKKEIVALGHRLGVPWDLIWSCYHGGDKMCGRCESCQRMMRAFTSQGLDLPATLVYNG
ncbi:7-cyano-7-deazaguanine synthase QueC [Desulfotomaculum nigrificans]|uniref:7-cyano-7-deazaguanine synthase QueC n=1 Tax=Desulfotomaculum nigrificans TaxID=1565 RepID=UPI0001FAE9FA|nr:7-cyano-7-deazaguanine synthase QueC [Desulfotomaculum nigrificans]